LRIVFHNDDAFHDGFERQLDAAMEILALPDRLTAAEESLYANADVIIGTRFDETLPVPTRLRLFHVSGAGHNNVRLELLPASAVVCNCHGHEGPIAEYVMAALLNDVIPFVDADARLRRGEWTYGAGRTESLHDELAGRCLGVLGYGHIGRAVAERARAFGLGVTVANRSQLEPSSLFDRSYLLS
jgi:phosphoglycerate dehydrogenase-like enzyme